jgi:hypothetical protein
MMLGIITHSNEQTQTSLNTTKSRQQKNTNNKLLTFEGTPAVSGDDASLASILFFCFFSLVWTAMSLALTASLTCCSVRIDPLYA